MASRHGAEFRAEAVGIALTSGLSRRQVAQDLGVGFSTLDRWIQHIRRDPEKPATQSDLEKQRAKLRRENRLLREEREALKRPAISLRKEANEVFIHRGEPRCFSGFQIMSDHERQSPGPPFLAGSPCK
ncbi:transposase [Roseibium denhamense]|uniref:transposase n=1 Tax=Roseibium denhamense TaxID=76305 RepID=UPI003CC6E5A9